MLKQKPLDYLFLLVSIFLYLLMGYGIQRHETFPLLVAYFSLFVVFIFIVRNHDLMERKTLKFWLSASLLFRMLLLFAVPSLSDDFYRFIWDGRLLDAGFHPFAKVPSWYLAEHVSIPGIDQELFNRLNSKQTFTIYPSFSQFIFWLSVKLSDGSVYGSMLVMKSIIFLFEGGTLWIMSKVFRQFNVSPGTILLYSLNPLAVLELTGNLHFEGVMVFFLMSAIFLMVQRKLFLSSLAYALAICTKLVPLLFLPLLVRHLGWKKSVRYWLLTGALTLLLFLPLLNPEIILGLSTSLGYYFQRFEFNASLYYLIREAGYLVFGFNIIQFAGPLLAVTATGLILFIAFRKMPSKVPGTIDQSIFQSMAWCMLIYLLSATILHPWYIITLLAISLFTPYRFAVIWTGFVFLSYAGYTETAFTENLLLVALEYMIVMAYLLYETAWKQQQSNF